MAIWTVFEHEKFGPEKRIERAVFVRDGFSFLAFLFAPLWLLAHGMIIVLIGYLALSIGASYAAATLFSAELSYWVSFLISFWFGFEAAGARRWALTRRGWQMMGVVEGRRRSDAERRYYENRLAPDPVADETARPATGSLVLPHAALPSDAAVLGLFPEGPR